MRTEIERWHTLTLAAHNASMHEDLIQPYHIVSESVKTYTFENEQEEELTPMRGYFALKETGGHRKKYFVEEKYFGELPIRVNTYEEVLYRDNSRSKTILQRPTNVTPFRIRPQQMYPDARSFIDTIAPFHHSKPEEWTLAKIVAVSGVVGKTFCGICSPSEFGKSSVYLILDAITQQCPVFQPRSVPGVLAQITSNGNMVFDEVHDAPSEVKSCMENFSLQVAGNSPIYINGALKSKNTKSKYDVSQQSITFLYNVLTNYSDPAKQFWDNIWSNTKAMQSRFLLLRFEGKLLEEFDKDFNIVAAAEENKSFYVGIAKHLAWLRSQKMANVIKARFNANKAMPLSGRHKIVYDEILWLLDQYSTDQAEFDKLIAILNNSINSYQQMLGKGHYKATTPVKVSKEDEELEVINVFEQFETEPKKTAITAAIPPQITKISAEQFMIEIPKEGMDIYDVDQKIGEEKLQEMCRMGVLFMKTPTWVMKL